MGVIDDGPDADADDSSLNPPLDEDRRRFWAETVWFDNVGDDDVMSCSLLFAHRGAEAELRNEMRLSELWRLCQTGPFTIDDFRELSALVTEVDGIRGALCLDCALLDRPNVSANWALATTMLCRGHLRFRLGQAKIDEDDFNRPGR